ncbi:hypothetical protein BACCIP111895_00830 [Neobacillus rhizosphaerae]|uniref:DUF2680 domain-containing protein n=1 Tax=Neobacillus rhizosphaerae TaxID=2880965 RepID=A0ABM9ENJ9_9BACI|nr:DUF2680 domain-containing protein [Neobacillus rhizosphaerae]CAH2713676.1 hypothetical protein BACCIP111895_00830 [Neobacillus rhizosphaerae]
MKWSYLLTAGAFVGVFSLGAMFAPIGKPSANVNEQAISNNLSVVQTADKKEAPQQGQADFTCPMTGEPMGNRSGMGMSMRGSMKESVADALAMSVDDYLAARKEGKSIADLAEEKGVKVKDIVKVMTESRKTELEKLVKEGNLTQEQMDNMLKNMEYMMEQAIERNDMGSMHGRGMGMGQGGGCGSYPDNQQFQTGNGTNL